MRFRGGVIFLRRGLREELSFGFVARDDADWIVIFARRSDSDGMRTVLRDPSVALDFVDRRKLLMVFVTAAKLILLVDVRGGTFARGAREGNGPQQKLGEVAEGGGFLAGDAALREQAKDLAESAVHACGGGEVVRGGIEFGKVELAGDEGASRIAEQLVFSIRVIRAERGVNVRAGHGALASIGEHELAALGQWIGFRREVEKIVLPVGVRFRGEAWRRNVVGACREGFPRGCW